MRTFHLITHFSLGGAERVAANIAESQTHGMEYHVVEIMRGRTAYTPKFIAELEQAGVRCHRSWMPDVSFHFLFERIAALLFPLRMLYIMLRWRPDVIHTHTETPDLALYVFSRLFPFMLRRVKIVRTIHNTRLWTGLPRTAQWVEKFFKSLGANIAISDSVRDSYAERFGEVPPIINNGVAEVEQKDYFNTSTPQGVHLSQVHQQHLNTSTFNTQHSTNLNTSTPQHLNTPNITTPPAQYPTFRNLIHNYNETHRWARFGNDLLLGVKADYNTTFEQQQFLPERLCADFERAYIISADGTKRNLVSSSFWLFEPTTKQQSIQQTNMSILDVFSPLVTFSILSILTLIIAIVEYRRKRIIWVFDTSIMLTTGACGLLLFAMIFSQHPTVSLNLQILLLNPINIFMLYSVTKAARQNRIHWWTKAWSALILLLLAGSFLQSYAEGITIVALSLLLRNISNIYTFKNTGSKQPEA